MIKKEISLTPASAAGNPKSLLPDMRLMTGEQGRAYGVGMIKNKITLTPAAAGNFDNVQMEFGRSADVQKIHGVKKGLLYLLCAEGKIKSVLIRRKGNVHGTRYFYMPSVSAYLHSLMEEQNGGSIE